MKLRLPRSTRAGIEQMLAGVAVKDGERIIPGRILTEIGQGNLKHGAAVIDRLIERMRDAAR